MRTSALEKAVRRLHEYIHRFSATMRWTQRYRTSCPNDRDALALATETDTRTLADVAAQLRDRGHGNVVTYSRKVFIPLTHLCRDVCHYCTSRRRRRRSRHRTCRSRRCSRSPPGQALGCKEALFTLGEKPELRYNAAREALAAMGFATTLDYLHAAAEARARGDRTAAAHQSRHDDDAEIALCARCRRRWASCWRPRRRGSAKRACRTTVRPTRFPRAPRHIAARGRGARAVHLGHSDRHRRNAPRTHRIPARAARRTRRHGHLQEIIVQNFRAKPGTLMAPRAGAGSRRTVVDDRGRAPRVRRRR